MHMATAGSISDVHSDIIKTHILTRLDPATLASASCVSSQLNSLITSNETLWTNICYSTWPSTNTSRLRHVLSSFPNGPRSFFSDSLTNPDDPDDNDNDNATSLNLAYLPSELISAVDIHYQNKHVLSKVVEIKTFNSSPFRVDLLDSVPIRIAHPVNDDMYRELAEGLTLSWILIDPIGRRAMNLSSYKPVTAVRRRRLSTSEVHVRYAWVFSAEYVKCETSVTCEGSPQSGEMQVNKVTLLLEDWFGKQLSGKDSLVILHKGMWGKRGKLKGREEEAKTRYEEYMEMKKRERILKRETTQQTQRRLDTLCEAFKVLIFGSLGLFVFTILVNVSN